MWQHSAMGILLFAYSVSATSCGAVRKFRGKGDSNKSQVNETAGGQNNDLTPIDGVVDPNAGVPPVVDGAIPDGIEGAQPAAPKVPEPAAGPVADNSGKKPDENPKKEEPKKIDPVEFVFLVDESSSMRGDKLDAAEIAVSKIIRQLVKVKPEVISKIFLVSSLSMLLPTDDRVVQIRREVSGDNGLTKLASLAVGVYRTSEGKQIKTDSKLKKHVVMISDGDAQDGIFDNYLDAVEFKQIWTQRKLGPMSFNSIVGTTSQSYNDCDPDDIGKEYIQLSDDDDFKGEIHDICRADIGESLQEIMSPILKMLSAQ